MYTKQLFLIAATLTSQLVSANCIHGTSLHKRAELPGGKVEVSSYGYTGLIGPLNWAGLAAENSACATSTVQSPINIDDTVSLATEAPVIAINSVEAAEFENLGSTIEVIINGTTAFAGKEFSLKQFHFHTPSEHRIAEEYFPLEIHMVHEAADGSGGIAVLAVTFQLSENGSTTELLTAVTKKLSEIATPGAVTETGPLDFGALIHHLQTTPLFQYTGSLTTPPCAEGLTFLVTKQALPLDVKTFNHIKSVVKFNSRYTQNALGRENLVSVGCAAPAAGGTVEGAPAGSVTSTPTATATATESIASSATGIVSSAATAESSAATTKASTVEASSAATKSAATETAATTKAPSPMSIEEHHCILGSCSTLVPT